MISFIPRLTHSEIHPAGWMGQVGFISLSLNLFSSSSSLLAHSLSTLPSSPIVLLSILPPCNNVLFRTPVDCLCYRFLLFLLYFLPVAEELWIWFGEMEYLERSKKIKIKKKKKNCAKVPLQRLTFTVVIQKHRPRRRYRRNKHAFKKGLRTRGFQSPMGPSSIGNQERWKKKSKKQRG